MKSNNGAGYEPGSRRGKKLQGRRIKPDISLSKVRAALSNGSTLLLRGDVDGRLAWSRRLRDLVADHCSDLSGEDSLSTAELVLVKRASMLTLQLEMLECKFGEQDGMATSEQLNDYQRVTNTLRRTLESLGLKRRPKVVDLTLGELLRRDHAQQLAEDVEEAEVAGDVA